MHPHILPRTVYAGTFIHINCSTELCVQEQTIVAVNEHGKIVAIFSFEEGTYNERDGVESDKVTAQPKLGLGAWEEGTLRDEWIDFRVKSLGWGERITGREENNCEGWELVLAGKGGWWFPGFVDAHIHASQYPSAGIFGGTLLDWLQRYVFPLEASLACAPKADLVYTNCVATTLRHGTTTAAYYATIDVPSTKRLADICLEAGQRAFIGRCNMDRQDEDVNPDYYRDASTACAIQDTHATISHIAHIDPNHHLVTPIITPRFAPSCTPTLLSALGDLAHKKNLPVQTHIAENPDEVKLVARLFPDQGSYAEVYDHHDLLTPRTVLGHAVHLTSDEHKLISKRGAKVAHCPISNSSLSSGLCPVRKLLNAGIEVGLGTDVSGGWSPSVLAAAREAGTVSRILASVERDKPSPEKTMKCEHREDQKKEHHGKTPSPSKTILTVEECLYLSTVGGASCLGLSDKVGRFELGMEWDAQLVNLGSPLDLNHPDKSRNIEHEREAERGPVQLWATESWEEKMAKWIFGGDDRNTLAVWVRGRRVHCRAEYFHRAL